MDLKLSGNKQVVRRLPDSVLELRVALVVPCPLAALLEVLANPHVRHCGGVLDVIAGQLGRTDGSKVGTGVGGESLGAGLACFVGADAVPRVPQVVVRVCVDLLSDLRVSRVEDCVRTAGSNELKVLRGAGADDGVSGPVGALA